MPIQAAVVPVIVPGLTGADCVITAVICAGLVFPQAFLAITEIVVPVGPAVSIILVVP